MKKRLFLVRHAQPAPEGYTNEFPGPPLGATGFAQAQRIARWLSAHEISTIYCSDYIRTQQTIQPLLAQRLIPQAFMVPQLRERDARTEPHESLESRVHQWVEQELPAMPDAAVIVGHCGSLNMILSFLDATQSILTYPYRCEYGCLTPIAGIWELHLKENTLTTGILHQP